MLSRSDKGFRFCACETSLIKCLLGYCFVFGVLQIVYTKGTRTDFDGKYGRRRGSAQVCALHKYVPFGGRKTKI